MKSRTARRASWCLLLLSVIGRGSAAQAPLGATLLDERAIADSQAVLKELATSIARDKRNAALWHRQGMVAWALYIRAEAGPLVSGLDAIAMRRLADTSLIIAADNAPANAEYQLAAGELLRTATDLGPRLRGVKYLERGYDNATRTMNAVLHARAALALGRLNWLAYELAPWKAPPCERLAPSIDSASIRGTVNDTRLTSLAAIKHLHNQLIDCFGRTVMFDNADYINAEARFREARAQALRDEDVFRHMAMLLAERKRWAELRTFANESVSLDSRSAWAWLTLGLAEHRLGNSVAALAAFDSGTARLSQHERTRLVSFTRLLTTRDSMVHVSSSPVQQAVRERDFWNVVAPLWSRPGGDPRAEFMARVVFAELRWTVPERGVRGSDSDRGRTLIRYGPPDRIFVVRGCDFYMSESLERRGCNPLIEAQPGTGSVQPRMADVVTYWDYDVGLTLVFWGTPSYGVAAIPGADDAHVATAVDAQSASFDNAVRERVIEIPTQLVRFRGPADSVDLVAMLHAPVAVIREASGVDVPARIDFWMFSREREGPAFRDSAVTRGTGVGRWTYRLAPGDYFYRIEATAEGSLTAGRAMGWIATRDTTTGFATRGFGLSDLLLASDARANASVSRRWIDFSIAPLLGRIRSGGTLQLLWENYDLAARNGEAEYEIEIVIERQRSGAGQIVASVVNALARAVRIDREPDRVTYSYERVAAHSPAVVDLVSLNLGLTPPGDYTIMIRVRDRISGRSATSRAAFTVAE